MPSQELFPCSLCAKTFSERRRYNQHLKTHSKPWRCTTCQRGFALRTDLNRHTSARHRLGQTTFSCNVDGCAFKTLRKDNLAQHVHKNHSLEYVSRKTQDDELQNSSCSVLMRAASTGDIVLLNHALRMGLDVNVEAKDGSTALHCAARAGQTSVIQYLLERGAAVENFGEYGKKRRPLHEAVLGKHTEAVTVLIQAGARIESSDHLDHTVIDYVVQSGDIQIAQALFTHGISQMIAEKIAGLLAVSAIKNEACLFVKWLFSSFPKAIRTISNFKPSPIHCAARREHYELLKLLLSSDETPGDLKPLVIKFTSSSLGHAAAAGDTGIVKTLLGFSGIAINHIDTYGETALTKAAYKGHVEVVQLLLGHKNIDVQLKNRRSRTALDIAFMNAQWNIVKCLARFEGISVGCNDRSPESQCSNLDMFSDLARYLLGRKSISVNTDYKGSLLHAVAKADGSEFAKVLLDQPNIDVNVHWWAGETPFHCAARHHRQEIFVLLLDRPEIDVNIKEHQYCETVLLCAVRYNFSEGVKLLLSHENTDLTSQNSQNQTALHLARELNHVDIIHLLEPLGNRIYQRTEEPTTTSNWFKQILRS